MIDTSVEIRPVQHAEGKFSPEEIERYRDILKQEGHVFLEKRKLDVPEVTDEMAARTLGTSELVDPCMRNLREFMGGSPVVDNFTNHNDRNEWRKQMEQRYGERFLKFYYDYPNQLRVNVLERPLGAIELLVLAAEERGNTQLAEELDKIHGELLNKLNGAGDTKEYNEMNNPEKLVVVHLFEDKISEILRKLV